jgi:anti-sigma-K factor RskA
VSLGVVGDGTAEAVAVDRPSGAAALAISKEPASVSPRPTGPVVATGTFAA